MKTSNIATLLSILWLSAISQMVYSQQANSKKSLVDKNLVIYATSYKTNQRLSLIDTVQFVKSKQPLETEICVFVNPQKKFQQIIGIGGAITDASAETFDKLPANKKQEFLSAYFDKNSGIGYSMARTNIHSCDFSSASYTYIDEGDKELKSFSVNHDKKYRIPLILKAIEAAGGNLPMMASPWSPPAFMKDNNNMLRGGKLLPAYYDAWANYFPKFIEAYEKEGIPIWGISVQNETMARQTWESCIYTAEEERDFLKYHLGPVMAKNGMSDKKIVVWDHNRDLINQRANVIFEDSVAAKYAWGIGFHWYETWAGGEPMFDNLAKVREAYPDENLIFTEGCVEKFTPSRYQYWPNAERYGRAMINDFNSGMTAWIDWNILLDEKGGPNHVGNFCFAPIHANTKKGELIYTPSYYYIGHFSKFVRPNARRVSTATSRSVLISTSFVNEDGKMVTVVMNESNKPVSYYLHVDSAQAKLSISGRSIQTLVY